MTNLVTAVTALKFIKQTREKGGVPERYLFAATGNQVLVFIGEDEKPSTREEIFPTEYRIHGFSDVVNNRMIIYGGRIVAIVHIVFSATDVRLKILERTEFDDWVWAVHWLCNGRIVTVACGHSTTYICDAEKLENSFVVQSEEKELTWSTTLFTTPHGLRAVAGSSFGDVLSWTLLDAVQLSDVEALLSKGMRNQISDKAVAVHRLCAHDGPVMRVKISSDTMRMATASVDRSVRVWERKGSDCTACGGECFGVVLVHYGHLARVWDVSFIHNRSVVSVGEDHASRVWGEASGREIGCFRGHAGRNIWSVAVCDGLVATGGEDGGVKVRSLKRSMTRGPFYLPRYENPRKKGCFRESCRSMVMIDCETMLVSTDFGRILRGRLAEVMEWTVIFVDQRGTAFTPCSLAFCAGMVIGGQTDGKVVVVRGNRKMYELTGVGMVMGIFAQERCEGCDVLIASGNGSLTHWVIGEGTIHVGKYCMERCVKSSLVTAACIVREVGIVLTGDRGGRLMSYQMHTRECWNMVHPVHTLRAHKDRVSTIHCSGRDITTSGFDGAVMELEIGYSGWLEKRSLARVPDRMDTITKYVNGGIVGFRGSEAVLWRMGQRSEVLRVDLGNWRRAHDVFVEGSGGVVGFWRGGGVYTSEGTGGWGMVGGHGGRVNDVVAVDGAVLTCGDDGLCVWVNGVVVQRLKGHTSVVHGVGGREGVVASVGGKDELFVWKVCEGVWRLDWGVVVGELVGGDGVGVLERGLCVCVMNDDTVFVGRSDGSVVKVVQGGAATVLMDGRGGVLCMDYLNGVIVVGDTKGNVCIMFESGDMQVMKVHQGGVNCVKVLKGCWVSGGDDGYVRCYDYVKGAFVWCGEVHTAAVTGLGVGNDAFVYSVGADQRVVKWDCTNGCCISYRTSIVDASSVVLTDDGHVVIAGIGLQSLHICD